MEDEHIRHRINELSLEHGDLDDAINLMTEATYTDQLKLQRMKRRKLRLKDEISQLESQLIPDIKA